MAKLSNAQWFPQTQIHALRVVTGGIIPERMSKRRWVEFKISQTISCSAPVSQRRRASSPATAGMVSFLKSEEIFTF